jgi:tetratricopeptide (TPR) repeat protein
LIGKGLALGILHKYNDALVYFDKALSIDANNVNALIGKGTTLGSLQRYSEALTYFDKALIINPNDPVALEGKRVSLMAKDLATTGRD